MRALCDWADLVPSVCLTIVWLLSSDPLTLQTARTSRQTLSRGSEAVRGPACVGKRHSGSFFHSRLLGVSPQWARVQQNACWLLFNQVQAVYCQNTRRSVAALSDVITLPIVCLHTLLRIITLSPLVAARGLKRSQVTLCRWGGRLKTLLLK